MNLLECKRAAENLDGSTFLAFFPKGVKKCSWLDPYLGLFQVEGIEGFLTVDSILESFPNLIVSEPYKESDL